MDAMQFEPMSVSRIIDRTFALYKQNFVRFVTIVAVVQVPLALISLVWTAMTLQDVPDTSSSQAYQPIEPPSVVLASIASFVTLLLTLVGNALCQGVLARNISDVYLGKELTVGQTFQAVLPKLVVLIGASILVGIAIGLGFLLLVVPGVIFGLWLFVTTPSIVVENQGVTAGMSRSKALTSGNLGKVFAVGFLAVVITWIISIPIGYVGGFLSVTLFSNRVLGLFVTQFATLIAEVLATPIVSAATVLLYYDLRIRKEAFDLQMLAESMGTSQG